MKNYSSVFKANVISNVNENGDNINELAKRFGIASGTLLRWMNDEKLLLYYKNKTPIKSNLIIDDKNRKLVISNLKIDGKDVNVVEPERKPDIESTSEKIDTTITIKCEFRLK